MENLRVLSGSVAVLNDIPARYLHPGDSPAQSRDYLLPGYFHDQYISLHLPENSLTTGTLFLGQPRCGKTNTIFLLADQVLNHMGPDDLAVFFDIKGDYQRAFYEEGDLVLDSLSSRYVWNIFDELLPYKNNSLLLKMRVRELCSYLYEESARDAGQNRFFVDGAQAVTECLLLCLLQSDTADSELNNANFLRLIGGAATSDETTDQALDHTYEEFLKVLNSDPDFYSARMYLPADPDARREGYGVLSEISRMVQRVFVGSFALAAHPEPEAEFGGLTVRGSFIEDKETAGKAILAACKEAAQGNPVEFGAYRGLTMSVQFDSFANKFRLTLRGAVSHIMEVGSDARGNIARLTNLIQTLPDRMAKVQARLDATKQQ